MIDSSFEHTWKAQILPVRPLILPPRRFVYPAQVEEVERGALEVLVMPPEDYPSAKLPGSPEHGNAHQPFLATCALGFADPLAPTGVWACPHPDWMCAVAGGYAYLIDTRNPEQWRQVEYRPVTAIVPAQEQGLLIFAGFHSLLAWRRGGKAWETRRLSWDGLQIKGIEGERLIGLGWEMKTDKELEFEVDLKTGESRGGGYLNPP